MNFTHLNRREFLTGVLSVSALALLGYSPALAQNPNIGINNDIIKKEIPSSKELLPIIGMGTWITFNVGSDIELRNQRTEVLRTFFKYGGGMIDCSPMYGSAADVIGYGLERIENKDALFSASKVWTSWTNSGPEQMEEQRQSWGIPNFDLMQIHNLMNWEGHLETLQEDKAAGKIKYIGITTSHGRRHAELENIMRAHDLDFVQLTYNIADREVENRLLPLAREKGIAVIANRPYRGGDLFQKASQNALPPWAKEEAGAANWAEFFLKFIVSHPAVTCAIPATSKIQHMKENMMAGYGTLPDTAVRKKMISFMQSL